LPCVSLAGIPAAPTCRAPADPKQPQPPCTIPPLFTFDDLANPSGLAVGLHAPADANMEFLLAMLSPATMQLLSTRNGKLPLKDDLAGALIDDLSAFLQSWTVRRDLLKSGPGDRDFVVEIDNDGYGHLRFG